jgi:integrase
MATGKITVAAINGLDGWLWDSVVGGLGVRKQRTNIFYYLRYRFRGRQLVKSLGRHGSPWTPDLARNKARELLGILSTGVDPFAQTLSENFGSEVDRYLAKKQSALRPRSYVEAERYLRKHAQPLHRLSLAEIDRRAVAVLLGQVETASGPIARNRMRSNLSAFWRWAIQEGLCETNPVQATAKANESGGRERVLTQEELCTLWRGLGDDVFSEIVRLLLLTAARRDEIGRLSWPEVSIPKRQIVLPANRCKNGREHTIPLSMQALRVIERIPHRNSSAYLFSDAQGFRDWANAKAALDQRVGIAPYRLHDLRRSAATYMAEIGVLPHVIEQALNHQSGHKGGIAGVYNRSKMTDAVREGLQRWADHLDKITE